MNFNAKSGCQKCTVRGHHSPISNTVVFTKLKQPLRTDEMFRNREYSQHQKHDTALAKMPIDLVKDIVVADPLHLIELGVMKRLLVGWITGNLGYNTKWSIQEKDKISSVLEGIKMPKEIHRDARSLKLFRHWKGLEFRNFINYYGIAVLPDFLPKKYYDHFLKLFCAVRLCSAEKYNCHLDVAKLLFEDFITEYMKIYGGEYITSNVHNLEHLVDDVKRFGVLSSISAYPFENCLYTIKRMIRVGSNPLVQIAKRLSERLHINEFNFNEKTSTVAHPKIHRKKNEKCDIELPEFSLSNHRFQDMWFQTNNNKVLRLANAYEEGSEFIIEGYEVTTCTDFFLVPFKSSLLNIYMADISNIICGPLKRVKFIDITCKFVSIMINENENKCVLIPLLHTIQ